MLVRVNCLSLQRGSLFCEEYSGSQQRFGAFDLSEGVAERNCVGGRDTIVLPLAKRACVLPVAIAEDERLLDDELIVGERVQKDEGLGVTVDDKELVSRCETFI